jgi:PAS domain-containing protein
MDMYRRRMQGEAVPPIYESAIQHRDGSRVEVEFSVGPTTYDRKPASLTMVRDIRERIRVERELEVGRRLLNLTIDSIPAQVAYVDNHQRYRFDPSFLACRSASSWDPRAMQLPKDISLLP